MWFRLIKKLRLNLYISYSYIYYMKSKSYSLLHKQVINFLLFSFGEDISGYVRDSYYYDYFDIDSEYNASIVIDGSIVDANHLYILKYI